MFFFCEFKLFPARKDFYLHRDFLEKLMVSKTILAIFDLKIVTIGKLLNNNKYFQK